MNSEEVIYGEEMILCFALKHALDKRIPTAVCDYIKTIADTLSSACLDIMLHDLADNFGAVSDVTSAAELWDKITGILENRGIL